MNSDLVNQLKSVGTPSLMHNPGSISDIINSILVLGILTGTEEKAVELVTERRNSLHKIRQELATTPLGLKGGRLYMLWNPCRAFSAASLPGEVLKTLGVANIAEGTTGERPILTNEYIL